MATLLIARCSTAFLLPSTVVTRHHCRTTSATRVVQRLFSSSSANNPTTSTSTEHQNKDKDREEDPEKFIPPWNFELLNQQEPKKKRNNAVRVRQHVNPLARRFQMQTILSENWPKDVFEDFEKPLFCDIGSAKGGFLLQLASEKPTDYNYLGLEIRPLAVQFAQERLKNNPDYSVPATGHLDFVGCNANVDLERLLSLYREATTDTQPPCLEMVTIQYPDPHFKASHAKRRVVTPELVNTLPAFMPPGAKVFLQSDVQTVLDEMRERFREASIYFQDQVEEVSEYYPENIIGVPTEREISVLKQGLPVYRALFVRTNVPSVNGSQNSQ